MAPVHPFRRPEFLADPYPTYRAVRDGAPLRWDEDLGSWVVARYDDVVAALRHPALSSDRTAAFMAGLPEGAREPLRHFAQVRAGMMLFLDPPAHTRLRGLVQAAFTPRVVEGVRARVQAIVDGLLAPVPAAGGMDVIAGLALPLPGIVVNELVGVPAADRARVKAWTDDFFAAIGGLGVTPEIAVRTRDSLLALTDYLQGVVADRRARPRDDLISGLVAVEAEGERLSENELLATCMMLLFAGHETTTNLIGNRLLALLRHPEQLARWRADPALARPAVEELLRYDSPVHMTFRVARDDADLGGATIRAGDHVTLVLGAANRDPAHFPEPDRLALDREDKRHVAFALGPHFCLGAALARLEAQVAIGTVVERFPGLRLADEALRWRGPIVMRALEALPIAC